MSNFAFLLSFSIYILPFCRYINAVVEGEEPGILLRLSDEVGLTPALLARSIIERHYQRQDKSSNMIMAYSFSLLILYFDYHYWFYRTSKITSF